MVHEKEKIIDDLLERKTTLYSMRDIQDILNISKSTLMRWLRTESSNNTSSLMEEMPKSKRLFMSSRRHLIDDDLEDDDLMFPQPDLYIGRSPRWSKETIKGSFARAVAMPMA